MKALKWIVYLVMYSINIFMFLFFAISLFILALIVSICLIGSVVGILGVVVMWLFWWSMIVDTFQQIDKTMKKAKSFLAI